MESTVQVIFAAIVLVAIVVLLAQTTSIVAKARKDSFDQSTELFDRFLAMQEKQQQRNDELYTSQQDFIYELQTALINKTTIEDERVEEIQHQFKEYKKSYQQSKQVAVPPSVNQEEFIARDNRDNDLALYANEDVRTDDPFHA